MIFFPNIYEICCRQFIQWIKKMMASPSIEDESPIQFKIHIPPKKVNSSSYFITGDMLWGPMFHDAESTVHFIAEETICKRPNLVILKCSMHIDEHTDMIFCVKLRFPIEEVQDELSNYRLMEDDDDQKDVTCCLAKIYAFAKFIMDDTQQWGALFMQYYDLNATEFLYESHQNIRREAVEKLFYNYENSAKRFVLDNIIQDINDSKRGVKIVHIPHRTLYTAVAAACIQLIQKFHSFGWVHGDTHLSNFMIDVNFMRVVLIDCERSFKSDNAVQRLLDIQEIMGHAFKLTVSFPYKRTWDMREVQAVSSFLHPLNSISWIKKRKIDESEDKPLQFTNMYQYFSKDLDFEKQIDSPDKMMVFAYLPVCSCFTRECQKSRMHGCVYCRSEANQKIANLFMDSSFRELVFIQLLRSSWTVLLHQIQSCRIMIRNEHAVIKTLFNTNMDILVPFLKKIKQRDLSVTHFQSEVKIDQTDLFIQRLIYLGNFVPRGMNLTRKFLSFLKTKSLTELHAAVEPLIFDVYDKSPKLETLLLEGKVSTGVV
jgi:hypothetical protein